MYCTVQVYRTDFHLVLPPQGPALDDAALGPVFPRRLLGLPEDGSQVDALVLREEPPQLLAHPGLDLLPVPPDLDWLPLVPRIV